MRQVGQCVGCGCEFTFDHERVPSVWVDGERKPACSVCVRRMNMVRSTEGRPPIVPLPGAYLGITTIQLASGETDVVSFPLNVG